MATQIQTSGHSWWFHLAQVGKSVGVGIGAFAGIAAIIPVPPVQIAAGVIAGVATVVTGYATKGVEFEESQSK
jgi:hypothetical protein